MTTRDQTRRQRYNRKRKEAKLFPIDVACIDFKHDGNTAFLIRSAACFGATRLHIIGSMAKRSELNPLSGSLYDYVEIIQHSTPYDFTAYCREKEISLVSAELAGDADCIDNFSFDFSNHICIVVGHEESGVPVEILKNSKKVYIDMPGVGFCLNASQTANIMLYEAVKQYNYREKQLEMWSREKTSYCLP